MKVERTKNAKRNIKMGLVNRVLLIIMPFISRTVIIDKLGAEYLGINSLFTSILQVLNMSELGFSSAVVYSLYKPIAEDDYETIGALLKYYRKIYRIIGLVILCLGLVISPFLGYFISGQIPKGINIYIVFFIYVINTSISYWLYSYKSVIPSALQREDINSFINTITQVSLYILQILVLTLFVNYYVYLLLMPLITVINNLMLAYQVKTKFPKFKEYGVITDRERKGIKEKIYGLLIDKICGVSRNSFDNIFLSMFLGLKATAMYSNYYTVMNGVIMLSMVFLSSIVAGIGNKILTDSVRDNYRDMRRMIFVYMWLASWSSISLLCLYQPFMKIWMGDDFMLSNLCVVLLALYFYILKVGDIRSAYSDALGLWWENRYRAIIETLTNIFLNYLLGKLFGIYGIIIATMISLLVINFGYGSQILFNNYYRDRKKVAQYYRDHLKYFITTVFAGFVTYKLCVFINTGDWMNLILRSAICVSVPNFILLIVYCKFEIFKDAIPWVLNIINKEKNV